jgi:hypothetical protein
MSAHPFSNTNTITLKRLRQRLRSGYSGEYSGDGDDDFDHHIPKEFLLHKLLFKGE